MYQALLRLMFLISPERIHHIAFRSMRAVAAFPPLRSLLVRLLVVDDPVLKSTVFGIEFPNPVGLAAGFDKNADGVDTWGALGFGFAEIGPSPHRHSLAIRSRDCLGSPTTGHW